MNSAKSAIIQSIHESAIREINALELRIAEAEDDADAKLWEQARQVVEQLKVMGQRELAAQWFDKHGAAYSKTHVHVTAQAFGHFNDQPRPRFRDVYNRITNPSKAHVSQNTGNNEWYTPAELIEAARCVLGAIDLDPASSDKANDVVKAAQIFTAEDEGLAQPWHGRVWMNPPYAQPLVQQFAEKLATSVQAGNVSAAVVLINNATETEWFTTIAAVADCVCFPKGRVRFWSPDRESASPLQGQAVLYAGPDVEKFCQGFAAFGIVARIVRRDDSTTPM